MVLRFKLIKYLLRIFLIICLINLLMLIMLIKSVSFGSLDFYLILGIPFFFLLTSSIVAISNFNKRIIIDNESITYQNAIRKRKIIMAKSITKMKILREIHSNRGMIFINGINAKRFSDRDLLKIFTKEEEIRIDIDDLINKEQLKIFLNSTGLMN